ncbi:MAG: hypothetical protein M3401_08935 [Actinomycetota bacterium]|nr:hypothetical protein [Actinomycetota bacterium]
MADAAGLHAHEHLSRPRLLQIALLHHERLSELLQTAARIRMDAQPMARLGYAGDVAFWPGPPFCDVRPAVVRPAAQPEP